MVIHCQKHGNIPNKKVTVFNMLNSTIGSNMKYNSKLQRILLPLTLISCKEHTIDVFFTCWYARIAAHTT